MMATPCMEPRCPNLATHRGRCAEHARQRDKSIGRAGRRTYNSKRWAWTRRHKLNISPICERCNQEIANTVHHKTDLAAGGDQYAMDNLESLCARCHSKETRARQLAG